MKRRSIVQGAALVAAIWSLGLAMDASAQTKNKEVLRYRLSKTKTVHLKDETAAKSYAASLKKLGIDSKSHSHDGHHDLTFSCPEWREAAMISHEECSKWEKWLKSLGFQTEHHH